MELTQILTILPWQFITALTIFLIISGKMRSFKLFGIEYKIEKLEERAELQRLAQLKGFRETQSLTDTKQSTQMVLGKPAPRDFVIEKWGALKQIIYTASSVNFTPFSKVTTLSNALKRLREMRLIDHEYALIIEKLNRFGQTLHDKPDNSVLEIDAHFYTELADSIIERITFNLLTPNKSEPLPVSPHRPTVIEEHFPEPQPGKPSAWLRGVAGEVLNQHFPIDKIIYRIGSSSENDLCIKDDDYVSSRHALVMYEKGSLFLTDKDSRNGTFLNDNRVGRTPLAIRRGDHIQIGQSELQLASDSPE